MRGSRPSGQWTSPHVLAVTGGRNMDQLRVGVIGHNGGGYPRAHLQAYAAILEAEVVAIADEDAEESRAMAAEFDGSHHYTDYREMLERHALDVVSVATPAAGRRDAALAAFDAGAHVMAAKPLAMNLAEAREVVEAAVRAGKLLSVALPNRFRSEVPALREVLRAGTLGHVYHSRIWHGHVMNIPGHHSYYRRDRAGGGALMSTTIHMLDAILWVLGNPRPVRVSAASYHKLRKMHSPPVAWPGGVEACDIEDFNIGLVHFTDGSTMTVESNWLKHPSARGSGAEILGDWGVASRSPLRVELEDGERIIDATPQIPPDPPDAYGDSIEDLCRSVLDGRVPLIRFSEMLNLHRVIDALYEAAALGEEIAVAD